MRPPASSAPTTPQGTWAKLSEIRKPMLAASATMNSLVSTVPTTLRGSIRPLESRVGVEIGPHPPPRSEEHTSELQSRQYLVCRLLLEKKKSRQTLTIQLKIL